MATLTMNGPYKWPKPSQEQKTKPTVQRVRTSIWRFVFKCSSIIWEPLPMDQFNHYNSEFSEAKRLNCIAVTYRSYTFWIWHKICVCVCAWLPEKSVLAPLIWCGQGLSSRHPRCRLQRQDREIRLVEEPNDHQFVRPDLVQESPHLPKKKSTVTFCCILPALPCIRASLRLFAAFAAWASNTSKHFQHATGCFGIVTNQGRRERILPEKRKQISNVYCIRYQFNINIHCQICGPLLVHELFAVI